jgi:hypothetical protein
MRTTALFLALMLAAAPAIAQQITGREAIEPPTESRAETEPSAEPLRLEILEGLRETLQLLRTPGFHPELADVFGAELLRDTKLPAPPTTTSAAELSREWWNLIIVAIVVGAIVTVVGFVMLGAT